MYAASDSTGTDRTIGAIVARAARYPVIRKEGQQRIIVKGTSSGPGTADPGIRWLLLDTWRVDRFLEKTGCGRHLLKGTVCD